jgi:hypothetical protein
MYTNMDDESTQPRIKVVQKQVNPPAQPVPPSPLQATNLLQPSTAATPLPVAISRRRFMGKSVAGLAAMGGTGVAAAIGGVALEQWIQHGGLTNPFQGSMASSTQIGHLLRRAGFSATPDELATYGKLGFNGAVDRLLNYQQVSDDDMENRLKALDINLNSRIDQQFP